MPTLEFRCRVDQFGQIDWPAVANTDFRSAPVKEGKQAEFLVAESGPWQLVRRVGAVNPTVQGAGDAQHGRGGTSPYGRGLPSMVLLGMEASA